MKVKIDECLPQECAEILTSKGYDAETVHQEGLQGASDLHIWSVAQREKRFLITTDLDFSDVRRYQPGQHAGILLVRLHKEGRDRVTAYLDWVLSQYDMKEWQACLVIATDHKVRIRKPVDLGLSRG